MIKCLYFPPFLATRSFDNDSIGVNKLFRSFLDVLRVREGSAIISARFPQDLRLTNEFHHTGNIQSDDFSVILHKSINRIYYKKIEHSLGSSNLHQPSALQVNFTSPTKNKNGSFDLILFSSQAGRASFYKMQALKKTGVPVVYFDNLDREYLYKNQEIADKHVSALSRQYALSFVKDVPVSISLPSNVIPIAPVPVSEKHLDNLTKAYSKKSDVKNIKEEFYFGFYGRRRIGICRDDRQAMLDSVIGIGKGKNVIESTGLKTNEEIYTDLDNSNILLSPSGRVWCSFRHTELAAFKKPLLLNSPDCHVWKYFKYPQKLTIDSFDEHSEVYEVYFEKVRAKIKEILNTSPDCLIKLSKRWLDDVKKYHTREKRGLEYRSIIRQFLNI